MLIRCLSKSLNEKLGKLETVVKNAGSNSLYKDLKIDVVNNLAYITSVNAKVCVIERLEVETDSNFSFLVEASSFIRFIKKQKNGEIKITLSDKKDSITIYYASGEYSCPAFDVNTFPMVYNIPDGGINVKMNDYVSILNKASNYTEINELYPCIENVVIDIDDININIVSTDRNTIYRYFVPNQDKVEKVFIPVSNASSILLDKHINKSLDTLSIKVDDTRTYFSTPDMDMYEIHFDGNYPNWRFVDEHFVKTSTYVFDKDLLVHALQNNIKINEFDHCKLIFTEKGCGIMSENPMSGRSCKERLTALSHNGNDIICDVLCGRYLGIVKSILCNRVVIEHDHKSHFNKIYGEDNKNEYFLSSSIIV
jgi:DNA polymerase III sliding clamp (beta) subunit (PCNA family)